MEALTPEARLAAAIGPSQNVPYSFAKMVAGQILAADPTVAADLNDAPRLRAENERLRAFAQEVFDARLGTTGYLHEKARAALTEGSGE